MPTKTNTSVQHKTIFNFQIKIELGNRRLNKKWYPFGITILFTKTQKLSKICKKMNTNGIVVNLKWSLVSIMDSPTPIQKKPTNLCKLQLARLPKPRDSSNFQLLH
jgi:hypothetical protein